MKILSRNELEQIVEGRLNMQSISRSLAFYGLANLKTYSGMKSRKFKEIVLGWPKIQQDLIFKQIAGIHWRQAKEEILG